jgi:ABC-2 type transport system ATP-binding protein
MIATLLEPTSGEIRVCGVDARRRPADVRRHLGVVLGGERSVYWKLTARENLRYFAALQGIPRRQTDARVDEVLGEIGLSGRADEYVERYSTGMRQRLVLGRALLGAPSILLLDEPTSGLDPQSSAYLRDRIRQLRDNGSTIVLTTHYMEEADQLSDRIAIIDRGRVVALDRPENLKKLVDAEQVVVAELVLAESSGESALVEDLGIHARVVQVTRSDEALRVVLHTEHAQEFLPSLIAITTTHGALVHRVDTQDVTLEDAFLALTGRGLRE